MYNRNGKKRGHAIALFSGGLDSALAILLMLKQDIEVTALTFMTHFGCDLNDRSSCGSNPFPAAEKFGFNVKLMHLSQKFVDIVVDPKYGRGKNMNVCIDCRILMLKEAKELMEMVNADFVITGEVMGQRPMSQTKDKMNLVIREAGLKGKLLRPLSAKLMPPTEPELSGMVDREQLEGISGRSRRRQLELSQEFGLEDYPSPASGCLLTDTSYSNRLRDLLAHTDRITFDDVNLLKAGRHFRLDSETKVIVGRNEQDNKMILSFNRGHHLHLEALDMGSPVTLLVGNASEQNIEKAAEITARYCSARKEPQVEITLIANGSQRKLQVAPARDEELTPLAVR
jgi:tRNA U34 2-thiouridine synthase MnmA/TrmU